MEAGEDRAGDEKPGRQMNSVLRVGAAALAITLGAWGPNDDVCNVRNGCLDAILRMATSAGYGGDVRAAGSGETAELMWCQLALTVYSWRRPYVDPSHEFDVLLPKSAVRENERFPDGSVHSIAWAPTGASLSLCASKLHIADPEKADRARAAATEWARTIVLAPEPPEPTEIVPLPSKN